MDLEILAEFASNSSILVLFLIVSFGFGSIYFGLAGFTLYMTRTFLPSKGIGAIIDQRPLKKHQIKTEIYYSFISIMIFGIYGVLTLEFESYGWVTIVWNFTWSKFFLDLLVIYLWNEIHFYVCHRSLHFIPMYKWCHIVHHRSLVPTPFSTYSFHWFEAALLGSVMIILLSVYPLSAGMVIFFPFVSLFLNNIGHMNYAVFPEKGMEKLFASCQRHTTHHSRIWGNYGFMIPQLDKWFNTRFKQLSYEKPLETADVIS